MENTIKTNIRFIGLKELSSILENETVVVDKKVYIKYREIFRKSRRFLMTPNEDNKNLYMVRKIYSFLDKINAVRSDAIYSVGGGITTDVGGFAAATFKRGMKSVLIPTTLLGMVDASIGGKTGVNFRGSKNLIGIFNQPERVYVCMDFLKSLSENQISQGLTEILKIGIVADKTIFENLHRDNISDDIVRKAMELKMSICSKDVFDHSARMMLNFGHTFAHTIEKASGYSISHGNAVSYGIESAIEISNKLGLINAEIVEAIRLKMESSGINVKLDKQTLSRLLKSCDKYFQKDKKKSDYVRFVLIEDFEKPVISDKNQEEEIIRLFKEKLARDYSE